MPSYSQPHYNRYGYPTPPEDYMRNYHKEAFHHQQQQQQQPQQLNQQANMFADPFMRHRLPPNSSRGMYPNAPYVTAIGTAPNAYYEAPVILPPMRAFPPIQAPIIEQSRQQIISAQHQEQVKEERPAGGVAAKLDYEMEIMTDFVTQTSQAMIIPNKPSPSNFRKWVHQVLSATRLPASTILLAFDYLQINLRIAQSRGKLDFSESDVFQMLTTALILGSKFLDDNTFINRSWAEVSGIEVSSLNKLEVSWLADMGFRLHREASAPGGFEHFQKIWHRFEADKRNRQKPMAYKSDAHIYVSRYGPIGSSASTSPPSAPHSGPTTPEYYGPPSNWPSINEAYGLSRLPPPAYTHAPNGSSSIVPQIPNAFYSAPMYASSHGQDCFCNTCSRQYVMMPHFGMPQLVAS